MILDSDADSSITADTDDQIDFELAGTDVFRLLTVTSAVNGMNLTGSITATSPIISTIGSDANIDLTVTPKGTGQFIITPAGENEIIKQRVFN